MNLKILFLLLMYYSLVGLFFSFSGSILTDDGYSTDVNLTGNELTSNETGTGGIFSTGISFDRWFTLVFFGIGLGASVPTWFALLFIAWETLITIFGVGWIVSSIWNG